MTDFPVTEPFRIPGPSYTAELSVHAPYFNMVRGQRVKLTTSIPGGVGEAEYVVVNVGNPEPGRWVYSLTPAPPADTKP